MEDSLERCTSLPYLCDAGEKPKHPSHITNGIHWDVTQVMYPPVSVLGIMKNSLTTGVMGKALSTFVDSSDDVWSNGVYNDEATAHLLAIHSAKHPSGPVANFRLAL